jgi:hypothetical protein
MDKVEVLLGILLLLYVCAVIAGCLSAVMQ